ncbi:MAG: PDZ domain-containing protein [Caulobacteraceae bacterium]
MVIILKIAGLIFKEFSSLLTDEFFWIILIILIMMYKKNERLENTMLGKSFPILGKVSGSVLVGIAAGILGSLMIVLVGLNIDDYTKTSGGSLAKSITYIWILAIILAMVNPRYLCFSYAGGIVALANLVFGFPAVNVSGLLALIGILHLIESFLIWFDGYSYSVPLFMRKNDGRTIGGYVMNKIWPIPLVVFAVAFGGEAGRTGIAGIGDMPSWWPLLKHSASEGTLGLTYIPLVVPVVLGYGDIAITRPAEKRCSSSAVRLAGYSVILIVLSILASEIKFFAFAAAVFAPLAHELLIIYGAKEEEEGKPLYESNEAGVSVLYTIKDSPAGSMGIEAGDVILSINGIMLHDEKELTEFLLSYPTYIWLEIRKYGGARKTVEFSDYRNGVENLGVLIVPRNSDIYFEINGSNSPIKRIAGFFREKRKKNIGM